MAGRARISLDVVKLARRMVARREVRESTRSHFLEGFAVLCKYFVSTLTYTLNKMGDTRNTNQGVKSLDLRFSRISQATTLTTDTGAGVEA